jgi:hypothetical protein
VTRIGDLTVNQPSPEKYPKIFFAGTLSGIRTPLSQGMNLRGRKFS